MMYFAMFVLGAIAGVFLHALLSVGKISDYEALTSYHWHLIRKINLLDISTLAKTILIYMVFADVRELSVYEKDVMKLFGFHMSTLKGPVGTELTKIGVKVKRINSHVFINATEFFKALVNTDFRMIGKYGYRALWKGERK